MTPPLYYSAVLIGRFQPFHLGHEKLLKRALECAHYCIIVLGSSFQARTPKNPFTWQERADMIARTLPQADQARLVFLPMRDYYNLAKWVAAVQNGVHHIIANQLPHHPVAVPPHETQIPGIVNSFAHSKKIALIGHLKDTSSFYLTHFSNWEIVSFERLSPVDATPLRQLLLDCANPNRLKKALAAIEPQVAPSTLEFLRNWSALPCYQELVYEWKMLSAARQAWAHAPYPPVFVTVDAVVHCAGHVLLIKRGQAPGKGLFAMPCGFIEQHETLLEAALRELFEETQIALTTTLLQAALQAVTVFDHPDRSLRGRTITHAHYFDLDRTELAATPAHFPLVQAGDDACGVSWVAVANLAALEACFLDDHFQILDHFLKFVPLNEGAV